MRDACVFAHPIWGKGETDTRTRTNQFGKYALELPPGVYDVMLPSNTSVPTCRKLEVTPAGMMVFNTALPMNQIGMTKD